MKNTKFYSILLLIICFSLSIKAQSHIFTDSLAKNYDKNTILLQNGFFEKNGERFNYGFFKNNLKKEMNHFIMSGREFKRYESKKWLSLGSSITGLAVLVTSVKDRKVNWTQYAIGTGLIVLAFPISNQSGNHYNRAIWFYNREAILRGQ